MEIKPLSETTVGEMVEYPAFITKLQEVIDEVEAVRIEMLKRVVKAKFKPKRDITCGLRDRGLWNADAIKANYKKILAKEKVTHLSSNERMFIRNVGDEALHRLVNQIKIEERNNKSQEIRYGKEEKNTKMGS